MKNKINIFLLSLTFLIFTSCDSFDEINISPNNPTIAPAENLFGQVFTRGFAPVFDTKMNCHYAGGFSGQIRADEYEYRQDINNLMWQNHYLAMTSCIETMKIAKEERNDNLYAAALTMKVFYGIKVTDSWGDVPYSEAFMIDEGVIHPKYDSQKEVYIQMLSELKEAQGIFNPSGGSIGVGDFLFKGDILKWQKFCNSLRLRAAIRAASGEVAVGVPTLVEIMGDLTKYPVMTKNEDNAYWWFSGSATDRDRWETLGELDEDGYKTTKWRPQDYFVDALQDNNDPRLSVYFDKNKAGKYNGYEFGIGQESNPLNTTNSLSAIGDRFVSDAGFMPLMNAAEVYFCMAEAVLKGYVGGGKDKAQEYYEQGIRISCEENGVTDVDITTFLAEPAIAWASASPSKADKIALQKWIVLIKQSQEAWAEVRRTDVPKLLQVDQLFVGIHNRPATRFAYSVNELGVNEKFPKNVVEIDIFWGTQVWWDKRTNVN